MTLWQLLSSMAEIQRMFVIGMFDAVIMLKALTTVLEMTAPMLKKVLPLSVQEHLEEQDEVLHRLLDHVEAQGSAYSACGPLRTGQPSAAGQRLAR